MLNHWQLTHASEVLLQGGLIAYPTESVYGLGCLPQAENALKRLLALKNRPAHKGLILLVSDIEQATPFIQPLTRSQRAQITQPRARATTWLIPRKPHLSELLCGHHQQLAVRVTTHPQARALCNHTGSPLVSTSCNRSGKKELTTASAVRNRMKEPLDLILAGPCGGQSPSQIIDLISGQVIRS